MPKTVNTRGLACPQPVILTRAALQGADAVLAIVDSETARQNVTRMAEKAGYAVQAETRSDGIYLHIGKAQVEAKVEAEAKVDAKAGAAGPLVLVIPGETMGRGDDELGGILIRGFFHMADTSLIPPAPFSLLRRQGKGVRGVRCSARQGRGVGRD
ncbi:MAG: sulfurtransferase TusA family protein [Anaerolineae bacterium]